MSEGKAEIFVQKQAPKKISRRDFLKTGAEAGIGLGAAVLIAPKAIQTGEALLASTENLEGKFLDYTEGKFTVSEEPHPVKVIFTTAQVNDEKNILLRKTKPNVHSAEIYLPPNDIKPQFAVRVFGDGFNGKYGSESLNHKDQKRSFGVWFMLSDEKGRPVDHQGHLLGENKLDRLYLSANFVSVTSQSTPNK